MRLDGPISESPITSVENAVKGQERCIAVENKAEVPRLPGSIDLSQEA